MGEIERAALNLALITLLFAGAVFAVWWRRRPRPEPAAPRAPKAPRVPGESRFPKLGANKRVVEEEVEIAPSRLARISNKAPIDRISETAPSESSPESPFAEADEADVETGDVETGDTNPVVDPAFDEALLATAISRVERIAHEPADESPEPVRASVSIRLVPQIPQRDAISTRSWLGGRPSLPVGMDWPRVDGVSADFLGQIACADLPADLWGGLGPRHGSLALFCHPDTGAPLVLHLIDDSAPHDVPHPPGLASFAPQERARVGDFAALAIRAFPEWRVDLVAVRPGDTDPRGTGTDPDGAMQALYARGYDIADPAFHPFDWDSMLAMAQILESGLTRLPADGIADDAASHAEAIDQAREIVAIIRESAGHSAFSAADATAVMSALHAIRWTKTLYRTDPETGEEMVEAVTLPLTTHRPDADLWAHDYLTILFDHAKHAWCRNADALSAPARAFFEPLWHDLAVAQMAALGHMPFRFVKDFDDERDVVLIELPTSGLMSRIAGEGGNLVLTMTRADLAAGDFSQVQQRIAI